jgi:hypothetical protein
LARASGFPESGHSYRTIKRRKLGMGSTIDAVATGAALPW